MSSGTEAEVAVKHLKNRLKLPAWAVSIAPWLRDGRTIILVRVDPRFLPRMPHVASEFEGFDVEVTPRSLPFARDGQNERYA